MSTENFMHPKIDSPSSEAGGGRLVMTLLVRNEEDIVRHTIDFHLSRGVDFIIATDNGSTDSTRDILKEYEAKGLLHLIDEGTHTHSQAEWNNRMARIAREEYGADYLFHCDADEFWHPRTGNLKDEISRRPEDILIVDVVNVLLSDRGGVECFPDDTKYAVVAPIEAKDYQEETRENNLFYYHYPPKVMFKSREQLFLVSQGNHAVLNKDGSTTEARSRDIVIYHYPLRSREHFSQKVILGGSAYEKNTILDKSMGFHKRRWYESYKKGLLDQEYQKLVVDRGQAEKLLQEGFLEELDFHETMNGEENRSCAAWRYYNRTFKYEALLRDFDKPWAGHRSFVYDLVRNLRPRTIVDLVTPGGTSFYAFCQGVRDARYDARLYAVDAREGNRAYRDEDGFRTLNDIRGRYYRDLRIEFHRKGPDEALGEFGEESIDLLHIDGSHTNMAARHDFDAWLPKVAGDGIVLLHEIFAGGDASGACEFWEELKQRYATIEFHHSCGLGVLFLDGARYQALIDRQREWRIRYSCMAEGRKNEILAALIHAGERSKAGHDKQVAMLKQTIADRESRIAEIYDSTSWRVTWPLRVASHQAKRLRIAGAFVLTAVRRNGGVMGILRKAVALYRRGGMSGLAASFRSFAASLLHRNDYAEWIRRYDTLTEESRAAIKARIDAFPNRPLISVVMPVHNPEPDWLIEAVESVRRQIYPNWELCIADDASTDGRIRKILERYASDDERIKVVFREKNGHISAASNSALSLASGEWTALLDHDDLLAEQALFRVAEAANQDPDIRLMYSDEDKIDASGERFAPYFKCDWNVDLFYSQNMVSHLGVYHTGIMKDIGGFREGLEGSQDYDLALRFIERIEPAQIRHIPRVLYHWRVHDNSTAQAGDSKPYAMLAGQKALNEHFRRLGVRASVELLDFGMYRVRYDLPEVPPLASIVILTRNRMDLLRPCVESILEKTTYPSYEILIVDNGSDDPEALRYLEGLRSDTRIRVIRDDRAFNFSALNNAAVRLARGEIVALLNNDVEVISPGWLSEMVSHALRPGVGAVGARLWYPDDTLQHGGVILGLGGVAGHAHLRLPRGGYGYFGRAELIQGFSAITAACLVIRKAIYDEVGGMNENELRVAFNDVDLCLRLREKGYRSVWTPYAELYHHESASRGSEDSPEKKSRFAREGRYMKQRWGGRLLNDPAYSPNLSLELHRGTFSMAWPPRVETIPGFQEKPGIDREKGAA